MGKETRILISPHRGCAIGWTGVLIMTRQEQIEQEAKTHSADVLDRHWFKRGAEWADQHPAWESVKDSLPEDDECCLIYGDSGIDIGSYNSKTQYWLSEYSGQPTHWMPMPAAPATKRGAS